MAELEARVHEGVRGIPRPAWDALVGAGSPFFEWTFLEALERDSAIPERGVLPQHLTLWAGERLVGALPVYLKADGRGEFIYDFGFAWSAQAQGVPYYPKYVSMAPFTPVAGAHLLLAPELEATAVWPAVLETVEAAARAQGLRGVHLLYVTPEEAAQIEGLGYARRLTFQLALENEGYETFEDYLARFRSKDRVKTKREVRRLEEAGIEVEVVTGEALGEAELEAMRGFYAGTCRDHGTGSDYLQPEGWAALFAGWRERLVVFFAVQGGERGWGSVCVWKGDALYGRYWGAQDGRAYLYFSLAFYAPLRWMIERGLRWFYVGSGNSPHKFARGFAPVETHSVHKVFHEGFQAALTEHLEGDRASVQADMAALRARSKFKPSQGA